MTYMFFASSSIVHVYDSRLYLLTIQFSQPQLLLALQLFFMFVVHRRCYLCFTLLSVT
jgi:hypothetical protein